MGKPDKCKHCDYLIETICPKCGGEIIICAYPERCGEIEKGMEHLIELNKINLSKLRG